MKAPTALRQQVSELVGLHMTPLEPDKKLLRRRLGKLGQEQLVCLLQLQEADIGNKDHETSDKFTVLRTLLAEILEEDACLNIKDLAVNGWDLQQIGFPASPKIGKCLQWLLDRVLDEALPNEKAVLLTAATKYMEDMP